MVKDICRYLCGYLCVDKMHYNQNIFTGFELSSFTKSTKKPRFKYPLLSKGKTFRFEFTTYRFAVNAITHSVMLRCL